MSRALAAAGPSVVDETEIRMVGESGTLETPLATTSYEVWELPGRRIATIRFHKWHVAARVGAQACGNAANYIQRVIRHPPPSPAIRRSSVREATVFLYAPLQVGAPATMNAEASFGSSRVGYQSAFVTLDICDGRRIIVLL